MTKYLVLNRLKESQDYISGEDLSECLKVSRTAIWKAVKTLREEGYIIKAVTNKGYILENKDLVLLSDYEIAHRLHSKYLGSKITILDTVTSTNDYIKNNIKTNGAVVISKRQTKGKAKNRSEFYSCDEGIYMSILYMPKCISTDDLKKLKQHIADSIKISIKKSIIFKDNEVFLDNKKVGGVLTQIEIENESDSINNIVVGIGLYSDCYDNLEDKIQIIANIINNLDERLTTLDK